MAQRFKNVYFQDFPATDARKKNLTLAFGDRDAVLHQVVAGLSSEDLRTLLGYSGYQELRAAAERDGLAVNTFCLKILREKLGHRLASNTDQLTLPGVVAAGPLSDPIYATFKGGASEPLHTWYPLLEGYSPQFVEEVLHNFASHAVSVLDPFSGLGTTPLVAAEKGLRAYYCEINPLFQYLTEVKATALTLKERERDRVRAALLRFSESVSKAVAASRPDWELQVAYRATFGESRFFDDNTLDEVLRTRTWIDEVACTEPSAAPFLTIAVISALLPASRLIRAGDVRFKTSKELRKHQVNLRVAVSERLRQIAADLARLPVLPIKPVLLMEDARLLSRVPTAEIDAVVTSPPYLNGTNYFRNTKVELWFLRCLRGAQDLRAFRLRSVTAGINDVTNARPILSEHARLAELLEELRRDSYDPRIPKMVGAYFYDLRAVIDGLRVHLRPDATVVVDIGDSSYGGVHVPTDEIAQDLLVGADCSLTEKVVLRRRLSRSGFKLKQVLLVFRYAGRPVVPSRPATPPWEEAWTTFKVELPHRKAPFSKRNWGHPLHSLCSYEGKMKPSLAQFLVRTFVPTGGSILDPFAGVGTIPFEAGLQGRKALAFEISPAARIIASAKLSRSSPEKCRQLVEEIDRHVRSNRPTAREWESATAMSFNRRLIDYYDRRTLAEILLARRFFQERPPADASESLVAASVLHILHGNRPYALSRRSHNTTPFAPTGPFEYRALIPRLRKKVERSLSIDLPPDFVEGRVFHQDATSWWPQEVVALEAIVTSPPFFDSTRFYLANWIRLWFAGWERSDFDSKPRAFVDERQKKGLSVYGLVFRQARERLRPGGVVVFHLGKSRKCDMAKGLAEQARPWFRVADVFSESVRHCESHGITDKGAVEEHQFLVLT